VNWRPLAPQHFDVSGTVYLDGVKVGGKFHDRGQTTLATKDCRITSPTTTRSLVFASIQLTDDDAGLNSECVKDLGDIVVRISQAQRTGISQPKTVGSIADEKVHERAKKAISHRVNFGEETVQRQAMTITISKTIATLVTFTFKYRSIDILRADGIAPPAPKLPIQAGTKRKASEPDDMNHEDNQDKSEGGEVEEDEAELKAQLRLIHAKLAKKNAQTNIKKAKTEPNTPSLFISGEIIDLT